MRKLDQEAVIARIQHVVDLAAEPRAKLGDIRSALRSLEAWAATQQPCDGFECVQDFVKARIERFKPTFLGGRGR
jgi:hypothetical protein